ncbi:MAG TPA: hypothetical protein VN925_05335, partial [Steroidobacteraceae bacterium]|nr:hypothetical protein [Steroidobacteraceae bacterium]
MLGKQEFFPIPDRWRKQDLNFGVHDDDRQSLSPRISDSRHCGCNRRSAQPTGIRDRKTRIDLRRQATCGCGRQAIDRRRPGGKPPGLR